MPPRPRRAVTLLQALLLGILQGLTEFLPVSSTAHLLLVPWALRWEAPADARFVFDVLVQDGTLLAVVAYFRRDLLAILRAVLDGVRRRAPLATPEARLGWWIVLGTLPVVAAGLLLEERVKALHGMPVVVAAILLGATVLLFLGEGAADRTRGMGTVSARDALLVGTAQAVALLPGVSRSAATIAGGLLCGLDRPSAARFSFLLSIPALLGAGGRATWRLAHADGAMAQAPSLAVGFLAAAAIGFASIHWLLGYLARRPLRDFAWYRIAAGLLFLGLALYRG